MHISKELLKHVFDGDLHATMNDVDYSTNLREIVTVEDMLNRYELEGR